MKHMLNLTVDKEYPEFNELQWEERGNMSAPNVTTHDEAVEFLKTQTTFKKELKELLLGYDASLFFSFDSDADIKDLQGEIEYSAAEKGERVIGNVLVEGWHLHGSDLENKDG